VLPYDEARRILEGYGCSANSPRHPSAWWSVSYLGSFYIDIISTGNGPFVSEAQLNLIEHDLILHRPKKP
jgi:hypothetical protein